MKENNKRTIIKNKCFDEERALYNLKDAEVVDCIFAGPADGESVLKETENINVLDCKFSLRYPLWHVNSFVVKDSVMDEKTRAALWYCRNGIVCNTKINGIKAVRECSQLTISDCKIDSQEFGWKSSNITMTDSDINSEYLFLDSNNISLENIKMSGKYSFQYINGLEIKDSVLDTKDAFWHSKNVTVKNSIVKGEYLGWFSEGLTLINCRITGTQPFCYCRNLKLVDCTMEGCDLAFEYSEVDADVIGHIDSIKNPLSGIIRADSVGKQIFDDAVRKCSGKIILKQ